MTLLISIVLIAIIMIALAVNLLVNKPANRNTEPSFKENDQPDKKVCAICPLVELIDCPETKKIK